MNADLEVHSRVENGGGSSYPRCCRSCSCSKGEKWGQAGSSWRAMLRWPVVSALRATAFCNRIYGQLIEDIKESLSFFLSGGCVCLSRV